MEMQKTVLILAGGKSHRFQRYDKCFSALNSKPLLLHTIDCVSNVADEIIVAARDMQQGEQIRAVVHPNKISLVFDSLHDFGPLAGILSGLEQASYSYALVIGCDMPFINEEVIEYLFELAATGYDAVVPSWANGMLEPLHAVYRKEPMREAITEAAKQGKGKIFEVLSQLEKVLFLPVSRLREIDPCLKTFTNINTPVELEDMN